MAGWWRTTAGGEKSLEYGKVKDYVNELRVVFADGNEYTVKPLNKKQLDAKIAQNDYEGDIYKKIYTLCEEHYDAIKAAAPTVTKNSMGYTLWEVWDRDTGIFDLTKLIVGSEGTLGICHGYYLSTGAKAATLGLAGIFPQRISATSA